MFGKKGRFEKKLARGEASRARATVLRVHRILPGTPVATFGGTFRVLVRVEPVGAPTFEATLTMHVTEVALEPHFGDRIPVIYHEDSVAWDEVEAKAEFGRQAAERLDLKPHERERFRATLLSRLDEALAAGKISGAEYAARRAEIEADPQLQVSDS
jgi:hypothetical protein